MGLAIELCTNLFQAIIFIGFLYLFFDKPEEKLKQILPFVGGVVLFFAVATYFTIFGVYTGISNYYIDSMLYIGIFELYTLVFLKGKLYLRVLMPLITFGINAIVSYTFGYLASFITQYAFEEALVISSAYRYFCIAVVNLTTALLLWLVLRFGSKRIRLTGATETVAFAVIPILCGIIMYCSFFAFSVSGFNSDILPYMLTICFVMVLIAILICIMLVRISKANKIKTDYLLTSQREKLYEESILKSNEQIDKISSIKHDMQNKLSTLNKLISNGNIPEASKLCQDTYKSLETTYTPVCTDNPVLNAILNVELEKASNADIQFTLDISDFLLDVSSSDIVSLIGNLCDNAIEYLSTQDKAMRKMSLKISSQLDFHVIACKNKIFDSVVKSNPQLTTTKENKESHGKGISILQRIAEENEGSVVYSEEQEYFVATAIVRIRK